MSSLDRPSWVTVIAVLMIIFGVFGMLSSAQFMFMPTFMGKALDRAKYEDPQAAEFLDQIETMFDLPGWFHSFAIIFGLIGLLIHGLYFFSGISLMQMKQFALKFVYLSLGLCLAFAFTQCIVGFYVETMMGLFLIMGGVISIVIDLILLIVVLASDKQAFVEVPTQQAVVRPSA